MSKSPGLIDSHCHLTATQFEGELDAVLDRAQKASVTSINVVGYTVEHSRSAIEMARRYDALWATVGVSPHDAKDAAEDFGKSLRQMAVENLDKVVAVGETGLDFFRLISSRETQISTFIKHIELAVQLGLPLVIHTRDAFEETCSLLAKHGASEVAGVFHCFTGSAQEALRAVELGFYVSFSGIVTFRNAQQVRESAAVVPDDRLLVETDAPFLAPSPMRGKRNEPSFLVYVVERLARIRGASKEHITRITAENACRLFGRGRPPE